MSITYMFTSLGPLVTAFGINTVNVNAETLSNMPDLLSWLWYLCIPFILTITILLGLNGEEFI